MSWCVGMADDADSKSVAGNRVWVQVPPPAVLKARVLRAFIYIKKEKDLSSEQTVKLIIIIVLVLLSAFFSSAETALSTIGEIK